MHDRGDLIFGVSCIILYATTVSTNEVMDIANVDYAKLKREYVRSNISYRKLAEKYDVPFGTLRKVAAKEKWAQLRAQTRTKADTKIIESISDQEAQRAIDIVDVADLLLDKVKEVAENIPLDTKAIKELTSALKDLKDIKGYKSPKDLEEQEARIDKLRREAMRDADSTSEVEVVFDAGPGDWNG